LIQCVLVSVIEVEMVFDVSITCWNSITDNRL